MAANSLVGQGFCRHLIVDARCAGAIGATGRQTAVEQVGSATQGILKDLVPFPLVVVQFLPDDYLQATWFTSLVWKMRYS